MRIVLDSSVSLSWCLPGQADAVAIALFDEVQNAGASVPEIWHLEMANIVGLKVRSGVLSASSVITAIELIGLLSIETEPANDDHRFPALLKTMRHVRLTAYDASYIALALRTGLPLATFDKEMKSIARELGVQLAGGL